MLPDGATGKKPPRLTTKEIIRKGSIIGAIVTAPSLAVFFLVWVALDDLTIGAVCGVVTHFIAMGFSLKISRRLLVGNDSGSGGSSSSSDSGSGYGKGGSEGKPRE